MIGLVILGVVAIGGVVHVAETYMKHRERMAERGLYTSDALVLAMRAAAYRAADPEMGDELVERIVQTVAEDLDNGVLTDPRPQEPA